MSLYNNANELLHDAVEKGLINLLQPRVKIGNIEIQLNNSVINVLNLNKWMEFLNYVIQNSDNEDEINYATQILESFKQQCNIQTVENDKSLISTDDVIKLSTELNNCNTVDDIFKLIGIQPLVNRVPEKLYKRIDATTIAKSAELNAVVQAAVNNKIPLHVDKISPPSLTIPNTIKWKRPIKIDNKCRYYAHNTSWYIERQDAYNQYGGLNYYYSLFSPTSKERARFDTLKDAKKNSLIVIKSLVDNR